MTRLTVTMGSGALCALLSCRCLAQEWPRFRGPNGAGSAQAINLPAQFTESDYRWKIELPGTGHSSPVVWADRIFVTCCDPQTAARRVVCIGAADGAIRWQREFASKGYRQHTDNSYASSSPAVDADRVYVAWTTPDESLLLAMDHQGKEIWRHVLGQFTSQHGSGTSPIVLDDLVILSNDQEGPRSSVVAVDRVTGKVRWETSRKSGSMAAGTPCLYQPPNGPPQIVLTSRYDGVAALDPKDGKVLWQVADAFVFRVIASPVIAGGLVIGNCGEGGNGKGLVAVRPPADGVGAQVAWKMMNQPPYVPTPLYKDGLLFTWGDTGIVTCLRAATGEVIWQERVGGAYYSSPVCVGDRIYCISKKGEVVAVSASEKFQLIGKSQLGELCYATPAIIGRNMYIRTLSHLICIGSK